MGPVPGVKLFRQPKIWGFIDGLEATQRHWEGIKPSYDILRSTHLLRVQEGTQVHPKLCWWFHPGGFEDFAIFPPTVTQTAQTGPG